jgi:hypothetical protein
MCSPPAPTRFSAQALSRLPRIIRWRSLADNAGALQDFIAECKQGGTTAAELETAEKLGFNTNLTVEASARSQLAPARLCRQFRADGLWHRRGFRLPGA